MGGKIAEEYSTLVSELWKGNSESVAPRDLKVCYFFFQKKKKLMIETFFFF